MYKITATTINIPKPMPALNRHAMASQFSGLKV
jgi:hypothetical protein